MKGYKDTLSNGKDIFIPSWPVDIALENLAKAGQFIGTDRLVSIANKSVPDVIIAIANSEDPTNTAGLIKHFCCSARIGGEKVSPGDFDEIFKGSLKDVAEIFSLVMHSQYHDFFESGLAEVSSQ